MNLAVTIAEQRTIAEEILTAKQLQAWELCIARGLSRNYAAQLLGISRQAVQDTVKTSERKIIAYLKGARPVRPEERYRKPSSALLLLIDRDGPRCYLCRSTLPVETLTIDHIIPTTFGGPDEPSNLAVACFNCNATKGSRIVSLETTSGAAMYHRPPE